MADSNPYPNARHRTTDWDPAGKSELEEKEATEKLKKDRPPSQPAARSTPGAAEGERDPRQQSQ